MDKKQQDPWLGGEAKARELKVWAVVIYKPFMFSISAVQICANGSRHPQQSFFFSPCFFEGRAWRACPKNPENQEMGFSKRPGFSEVMENMMEVTEQFFLQFNKLRLVWLSYP